MRSVRLVADALLVVVAAYVGSLLPGVRDHLGTPTFWNVGVYVLAFVGSSAVCLLRAVAVRADRWAWACVGAGLLSYAAGTLLYQAVVSRLANEPYPSVSDGLWLLLYPATILGIWLFVRARVAGSVVSLLLDGVISGLGVVSVAAAAVLPRLVENAPGPVAEVVTNLAYPLLDLALAATVVGAMAAIGAWRDHTWLLLVLGFLTFAVSDSWYLFQIADGTYSTGSVVDAMYLVAVAMVALAAAREPAPPDVARSEERSFVLPLSFALLALAVLVFGSLTNRSVPVLSVALAVTSLLAAGARTALAVHEVVQLADSRRQALTDALTGLPNRRAFYELVQGSSDTPAGAGEAPVSSVLIVDLDRFKEINDALGHQMGDLVLQAVTERLSGRVPPDATIARLGGDEMALFWPERTTQDGVKLAQWLLAGMDLPFAVGGLSLHLSASIGITTLVPGDDVGQTLAQADLAMYRAKAARAGWAVYDPAKDGDAWNRLATLEYLREAVTSGGLTVAFQPIVRGSTLEPVEVEALVRWNHPVRGPTPPDSFLPLAEQAGLMPLLTRVVLSQALDQAQAFRRAGLELRVAVNLSASDLLDVNLVDAVTNALAERDLSGDALRLEITESLLVEDVVGADALLERLRAIGVDLAVDDYGTGFSSLGYLHDLPVSTLKIDRGFTGRLMLDSRTAVIVASTIEMAHRLGLAVVAEGVETDDQIDWLRAHGCDYLQGYRISRPVDVPGLSDWLLEWAADPLRHDVGVGPVP